MTPNTQTDDQKNSRKYRTLVVIIGVLVALVIGFSVSGAAELPKEMLHDHLIESASSQKIWGSVTRGLTILHNFFLEIH